MPEICTQFKLPEGFDTQQFLPICPICSDFPLSEENMRKILAPADYGVMRLRQDEEAGSHPYAKEAREGTYHCRGCNSHLFESSSKIRSEDYPRFERTCGELLANSDRQIICAKCECYLGREETGGDGTNVYRINGAALQFYAMTPDEPKQFPVAMTDKEWQEKIGDNAAYKVLRESKTEAQNTSELVEEFRSGKYLCRGCDNLLFESKDKFRASCGWPSFCRAATDESCGFSFDYNTGFRREEVHCKKCGGHLGHRFNDAPDQPTGERFCINGVCLKFVLNA